MTAIRSVFVAAAAVAVMAASHPGVSDARSVYRWVDNEGTAHYADKPTPGSKFVNVERLRSKPIPDDAPLKINVEKLAELRRQCLVAEERLASYREAPQVFERTKTGSQLPLSEAQTRLMLMRIEKEANATCAEYGQMKRLANRQSTAVREPAQASPVVKGSYRF